jgi:hypothetical protein
LLGQISQTISLLRHLSSKTTPLVKPDFTDHISYRHLSSKITPLVRPDFKDHITYRAPLIKDRRDRVCESWLNKRGGL